MPDDTNKREPFDLFTDQFTITITPFGANLTFHLREPHPSPSKVPQAQTLGTIRMSVEHLKTMIMIIRNQVLMVEEQLRVKAEVPREILNQLKIPVEDWEAFWKFGSIS